MPIYEPNRVVVIGAGIAGLTTATLLQQAGYAVTVLEAQTYPGGSASTYYHKGFRFESGATVAGGYQPNGPHAVAGERMGITDWPIRRHDPAWVTHLPDRSVALTAGNEDVLAKFPNSARFWQQQSRLADIAWTLSAQGMPWPPRSLAEIAKLAHTGLRNFPRDLYVLPFAFATVYDWLRWNGLHKDTAFVRFLDAQLLISAQTTTRHVNALWGATALDLARQGVYHVKGGIGNVAETIIQRFEALGGKVLYRHRAHKIVIEDGRATAVIARRGHRSKENIVFPAEFVVGNVTPWNMHALFGDDSPDSLRREVEKRKSGWGAFVLHLGVKADAIPADFPDHHQIITTMEGPLGEGRSIFMSFSPTWDATRAPEGQRALTVTTHTNVQQWWDLLESDEATYYRRKGEYAELIISEIDKLIPGFRNGLTLTLPGTPVTYQFYTDRYLGMVGGFPSTSLFRMRGPRTGISNTRIVGDSIFPGQSTAGVSLGAMRVSDDVMRNLPVLSNRRRQSTQITGETTQPEAQR